MQVTFELNNDNKDIEISGLLEAMDEVKLDEGLIITYDQEDEFTLNRKRTLVRPAWKWMQENFE